MEMTQYQLKREMYDITNQTAPFDDTIATMQRVTEELLEDQCDGETSEIIRETVWQLGSDAVKSSLVIGSVVDSASFRRSRVPERKLFFRNDDELANASLGTANEAIAVSSLYAVADRYIYNLGTLPSGYVPWAVHFATTSAGSEQQAGFTSRLGAVQFSDRHTDSGEDMSDPHPVGRYLHNENLSLELRSQLLRAALGDIKTTSYKPSVWSARLKNTFRELAGKSDNPLRFEARERLAIPVDDDEFEIHVAQFALRLKLLEVEAEKRRHEAAEEDKIRRILKQQEIYAKVQAILEA